MKHVKIHRVVLWLLLVCFAAGVKAQGDAAAERDWRTDRQKIKIVSYNILDGFDRLRDRERMGRFAEWVKQQAPDVLALDELCGFTEADLKKLAAAYGHSYVAIVKEEGYPVGITSNAPLEVVEKRIKGYGHGLLHCRVYGMDFLATHLNPSDWRTRKREADNIVAYIQEKNLEKCLVLGDLNAHSPFDAEQMETRVSLMKAMVISDCERRDDGRNLNNGCFEYSVISTFLAASLHDTGRAYVPPAERYSYPTRILVSTPKGEAVRQQWERLDYILVSDALRPLCVEGTIYHTPETDYLSDHYPVGVTMLIPKQ